MRNRRSFFLVVTALILGICAYTVNVLPKEPEQADALSRENIYTQLELFADAISIINANYVDKVDPNALIYGALKGMLQSLDTHSGFLTPDQYEEIKIDTGGEFGGLGIEISIEDNLLTIITPLEGTPAEKAGIMPGYRIIRIDGESTEELSLDECIKKMRGLPGTKITLTILREDEEALRDYVLKRALIKVKSVKYALILEDNVGYIRITDFQQRTAQELEKALRSIEKKGKLGGLILDLRNNPGGLLESSLQVAEQFLPKDSVIVSIKGKVDSQNEVFKSKNNRARVDFPIVVLVNKGSASASEIVAGAIKDNKRGLILGTPTFGKASVQTVIPLRDNSAIRLTTSKYYTPNGEQIHNVGIMPDVLLKKQMPTEEEVEETLGIFDKLKIDNINLRINKLRQDNQVESAVELIKGINVYRSFSKEK
ncbi:MAG: S41 family peptidase [Candidatus Omnitrophota bacterium]